MTSVAGRPERLTPPPVEAPAPSLVRRLDEMRRTDVATAGGKGANLGEMLVLGLPVPPGFVVTTAAYQLFIAQNALAPRIAALVATMRPDDPASLADTSKELRDLILRAALPDSVTKAVLQAYNLLSAGGHRAAVAVRSSATSEDAAGVSFAGMFESVLDVHGADALISAVRRCWASAFGARVLFYRVKQGLPHDAPVAVVVQRMVHADKAGVIFTADPATGDASVLIIEAAPGLGEGVVQGAVTPDHYRVDKTTLEVSRPRAVSTMAATAVLSMQEIRRLAALARSVELNFGVPQDIEFAITGETVFLTQSRPVTTGVVQDTPGATDPAGNGKGEGAVPAGAVSPPVPLVRGLAASPGRVTGAVRVLATPADGALLGRGEVLVTRMTAPDWAPVMRRAAAIVTDAGGMTSHAAIVARELGLPCVVGTRDATQVLRTGQRVTVDGAAGIVLPATADAASDTPGDMGAPAALPRVAPVGAIAPRTGPITATRLYVNLGEPDRAEAVAALDVDGVGLLRAEFMMLAALEQAHPRQFLRDHGADEFVRRMRTQLERFARAFAPRPVVYRAMDFRSNEFRGLAGGAEVEPSEANPMIGYRGCYRYTREPDLFALELRALAEVREHHDSLHLMIPFVRTRDELAACLRLVDASPLAGDRRLERWVMAEVPSVVHYLPDYAALGVTGVSIGSNDLTQLMLGVDRDSELMAPMFDERDAAVLAAVESIVKTARRLGLTSSICGQAPSVHPVYVERLVEWGIDSISVNPDAVDRTRRHIAMAEQRLLVSHARAG